VNFVNNNITGGGKLVVTVINVFGSWLGDFVAPGQQQRAHASSGSSNNSGSESHSNSNNSSSTVASAKGSVAAEVTGGTVTYKNSNGIAAGTVKGSNTKGSNLHEATVAKSVGQDGSAAVADKKLHINLAWLIMALPLAGIAFLFKKSFVPVQKLALRGIHLFL